MIGFIGFATGQKCGVQTQDLHNTRSLHAIAAKDSMASGLAQAHDQMEVLGTDNFRLFKTQWDGNEYTALLTTDESPPCQKVHCLAKLNRSKRILGWLQSV